MTTRSCIENLRRACFAAFLALALSACGGNDGDTAGAGSNVDVVGGGTTGDVTGGGTAVTDPVSTTLSAATVDADIQALRALSPAQRESQARVSSAQVERELLTISGVESELGGAAAADAAYAGVAAQLAADAASTSASIVKIRLAQARRVEVAKAGVGDSVSGVLFGGLMQVTLLSMGVSDISGNNLKPGESKPFGGGDSKGVVTLEELIYDSTYAQTSNGLDAKLNTHFDLVTCPDANGEFTAKATLEASMTKSGGATGGKSTLAVSVTGHVDDNAELVYYDIDTHMEMAEFTNRKGAYVDFNLNYAVGSSPRSASGKLNRSGGQVTDAFANNAYATGKLIGMIMAVTMVDSAEKAWKSGRCVALEPTTNPAQRTGLQPATAVAISAAPRSKIDGGPAGGSVTGTLSGDGALAPSGTKVTADASFTYTAPGTAGKAGRVSLEARSKRGVAKADLNFDTANDRWIGTASFSDEDFSTTAEITWVLVSTQDNISTYKSTGPGTITMLGSCTSPRTITDTNGAALLFVDFNSTPPTYHGLGTSGVVTLTVTCVQADGSLETVVHPGAAPVFGGTKGSEGVEAAGSAVVSPDGSMKIEGTDTDGSGGTFRWSFTRGR